MQSVSTGIAKYLSALDPAAAKTLRAARSNRRFEAAVRRVWDDNPFAAEFVLAHVNSLYFAKDETPRKGPDKDVDRYVLGLYVDDPTARAEINARRETLSLALMQDGFRFDEVRIFPSRMGMRERHAFPESVERAAALLAGKGPLSDEQAAESSEEASAAKRQDPRTSRAARLHRDDESRLLETFKRAACQAIGDVDQTAALLARVEGAALEERYGSQGKRQRRAQYACRLYVASPEPLREVLGAFGPSIIAHAKELGLNLVGIDVRQSPAELSGSVAFPACGAPVPYRADHAHD